MGSFVLTMRSIFLTRGLMLAPVPLAILAAPKCLGVKRLLTVGHKFFLC